MPSILDKFFYLTLLVKSLSSSKAQDATVEGRENGDVTEAEITEKIVKKLKYIESKLDDDPHKDLLVAISTLLKEGVLLLHDSLDKSKNEQKALVNEDKNDGGVTSYTMPSCGEPDILTDTLQLFEAMVPVVKKIESNRFTVAKKRFEKARTKATLAFCNEALSIQNRILAAKLRVVSEMLECLDSPDTAITSYLSFLEDLHDWFAVRKMFSVYIDGGIESIFGKTEREENITSIKMINSVLYQFVQKFGSKYYSEFAWPSVQLSNGSINLIQDFKQTSSGEDLKEPSKVGADEEMLSKTLPEQNIGQFFIKSN